MLLKSISLSNTSGSRDTHRCSITAGNIEQLDCKSSQKSELMREEEFDQNRQNEYRC